MKKILLYSISTWARPIKEGVWEAGCDVRYWLLTAELLYVELPERLASLVAGEPFARVTTSKGEIHELIAPMTGVVKEINNRANEAMSALIRDNLSGGWLLWLVRVQPVT